MTTKNEINMYEYTHLYEITRVYSNVNVIANISLGKTDQRQPLDFPGPEKRPLQKPSWSGILRQLSFFCLYQAKFHNQNRLSAASSRVFCSTHALTPFAIKDMGTVNVVKFGFSKCQTSDPTAACLLLSSNIL